MQKDSNPKANAFYNKKHKKSKKKFHRKSSKSKKWAKHDDSFSSNFSDELSSNHYRYKSKHQWTPEEKVNSKSTPNGKSASSYEWKTPDWEEVDKIKCFSSDSKDEFYDDFKNDQQYNNFNSQKKRRYSYHNQGHQKKKSYRPISPQKRERHVVSNIDYKYVKYLEYFSRNQELPQEIEIVLDDYQEFFTEKCIMPVNMRFFTFDQNNVIPEKRNQFHKFPRERSYSARYNNHNDYQKENYKPVFKEKKFVIKRSGKVKKSDEQIWKPFTIKDLEFLRKLETKSLSNQSTQIPVTPQKIKDKENEDGFIFRKMNPMKPDSKIWFYIDDSSFVRGPFSSSDMDAWNNSGYFYSDLQIAFNDFDTTKKQENFVMLKQFEENPAIFLSQRFSSEIKEDSERNDVTQTKALNQDESEIEQNQPPKQEVKIEEESKVKKEMVKEEMNKITLDIKSEPFVKQSFPHPSFYQNDKRVFSQLQLNDLNLSNMFAISNLSRQTPPRIVKQKLNNPRNQNFNEQVILEKRIENEKPQGIKLNLQPKEKSNKKVP